ncbi:hypothetical protein RFI_32771 [Reticulomyxa filosa]|uniref:RWD domain-containing protein n=1 Tax=Reticulomyxa filosa TaxID=46433 RepID=X6LTB0_RETFI|nr:hypothetical protein RFI_32771 [Reticulomyxa filosa]|eukprot:ETO04626.1 hypothetical protein RFI_32771 [Reticulomyxa filosa]
MSISKDPNVSNLERQLAEFEVLGSVYSDSISVDSKLLENLKSFVENPKAALPITSPLRFDIKIATDIIVQCTLPLDYPLISPQIAIDICNNRRGYSKVSLDESNEKISTYLKTNFVPSQETLFETLDWIINTSDIVQSIESLCSDKTTEVKSPKDNYTMNRTSQYLLEIKRLYIWFHHIYDPKKKTIVRNSATNLKLRGFLVTGKPGRRIKKQRTYNTYKS